MADHVTGQTRFGHVTFPQSRASEVPESRFMTYGAFITWNAYLMLYYIYYGMYLYVTW